MAPSLVENLRQAAAVAGGYLLIIFGGGWLVGRLLRELPGVEAHTATPGPFADLSLLIGWPERFLALTFVLVGQLTALGLVVAAKSLLRYGEAREDRARAEFVLCGTLASPCVAIGGGLLLRWVVQAL